MLKRIMLLACAVLSASAAAPRSAFDGKWHWAGSAGWQRIEFEFSTSGRTASGTLTMGPGVTKATKSAADWEYFFEPAAFPIQNGRLEGDTTITFEQSVVRNAGTTPNEILKYTGRLNGDRIEFTRESIQRPRDAFILGNHKMQFVAVRNGSAGQVSALPASGDAVIHSANPGLRMSVFANVLDRDGNRVTNLPQSAFTILEDGNPLAIQNFAAAETPANVLMLYDHNQTWFEDNIKLNSSGFGVREWSALLGASTLFINQLRAGDSVAMAEFESSVKLALDWRNAHSPANKNVQLELFRPPSGQKDLYGAIEWAMQKLDGVHGRKIAVVFTDGRDGRLSPRWLRNSRGAGSRLTSAITRSINSPNQEVLDPLFGLADEAEAADFEKLVNRVARSGVQLYFVSINTDRDPEFGPAVVDRRISGLFPGSNEAIDNYIARVHEHLERLAGVSGGRVFYGDMPEQGVSIYETLRQSVGLGAYSLEFIPSGQAAREYHQLEILVNDSNGQGLRVSQSVYRFR